MKEETKEKVVDRLEGKELVWTQFMDMHSGGGSKLKWDYIYIEAPAGRAEEIFEEKFDRNPHNVTCDCCGSDYSVQEEKTLEQATGYHRRCEYDSKLKKYVERQNTDMKEYYKGKEWKDYLKRNKHITIKEYEKQKNVLILRNKDLR